MPSTQTDETGSSPADVGYTKRFVTSVATRDQLLSEDEEGSPPTTGEGYLMSRRSALGGGAMGAAAVLCFVLSAGFSSGAPEASTEKAQEVFDLREQISVVEAHAETLPEARSAARGLVTAQASAGQIAELQNDYRHLTPDVAAAGGTLDEAATVSIRHNLTPYFAPSVDQSVFQPWYLLASDKDVPAAVGIPMSFDSGFAWVAQRPYSIKKDSTIEVVWLAVQTRPAEDQAPAVLAWARSDYDMTRKTFTNVETGTTTTGQALRQEVKEL